MRHTVLVVPLLVGRTWWQEGLPGEAPLPPPPGRLIGDWTAPAVCALGAWLLLHVRFEATCTASPPAHAGLALYGSMHPLLALALVLLLARRRALFVRHRELIITAFTLHMNWTVIQLGGWVGGGRAREWVCGRPGG